MLIESVFWRQYKQLTSHFGERRATSLRSRRGGLDEPQSVSSRGRALVVELGAYT